MKVAALILFAASCAGLGSTSLALTPPTPKEAPATALGINGSLSADIDDTHTIVRETISDLHDAADLVAQQRSALAARWQVVVGLVAAVISAIGTVLLLMTLRESRRTTEAALRSVALAKETAEWQLRAYVVVTEHMLLTENGNFWPRINLQNAGQTPAYRVRSLNCAHRARDGETPDWKALLDEARKKEASEFILGPGSTSFNDGENFMPVDSEDMTLYLFGEITYVDIFGVERCTTYRSFQKGQVRAGDTLSSGEGNTAT